MADIVIRTMPKFLSAGFTVITVLFHSSYDVSFGLCCVVFCRGCDKWEEVVQSIFHGINVVLYLSNS